MAGGAPAPPPGSSKRVTTPQSTQTASGVSTNYDIINESKPMAVFVQGVANSQGLVDYFSLPPVNESLTLIHTTASIAAGGGTDDTPIIDMRYYDHLNIVVERVAGTGNDFDLLLLDAEAVTTVPCRLSRIDNNGVISYLDVATITSTSYQVNIPYMAGTRVILRITNDDATDAATYTVSIRRSKQVHQ